MAEDLRSIEVEVTVDTNKRTLHGQVVMDSLSDDAIETALVEIRNSLTTLRDLL
jgi:hypothetical protein